MLELLIETNFLGDCCELFACDEEFVKAYGHVDKNLKRCVNTANQVVLRTLSVENIFNRLLQIEDLNSF